MCPGEETVAAYVAGQLAPAERDAFDSHLDTCRDCGELVAALAKLGAGSAPARETVTGDGDATPAPDLASAMRGGQLGRYVLLARLGAGGMGVVYAAYDPELDRRVALKVLRHGRHGTRLRDEARAIAKLAHPNVVAVHDVGEADGETFVAMEYVDGVTVRDWLATKPRPAEILDVFVQAGRGLAAAHAAGLVHRDIKPSNILVGKDGRARVADFGLAQAAVEGERGVAGTPGYMAPEQERGERIDARADQYAFCRTLAQALAGDGRATAHADADDGSEHRHDDGRPRRGPRDQRPHGEPGKLSGLPDRVVRAIGRGMSARPDDRFASMDALLAELAPRSRRGPILAAAIAGGAVVGALAFAFARPAPARPSCDAAAAPLARVWGPPQRASVQAAFAATRLPYADGAAASAVRVLDDWAARWQASAVASCRATVIDRVQPAELHALRQGCLERMLGALRPVVELASHADPGIVARADVLVGALPGPEPCDDTAALAGLPPLPPGQAQRSEAATLGADLAAAEAAILAGRARTVDVAALAKRAEALGYLPLRARSEYVRGRLAAAAGRYGEAIPALHAAARFATAARDLEQLATIWIELAQTLGNDPRTSSEAAVFDGYAEALLAQLPDRDRLGLQLAFARCNRNVGPAEAATVAAFCRDVIARAEQARPELANAARVRLGHFLLLAGKPDEALATARQAVAESVKLRGELHPDTAVAHHALGLVLIAMDQGDEALAEQRKALEIRRVVYPGGSIATVESLVGVADALSVAGKDKEARPLFEEAVAMAERVGEGQSAQAMIAHVMFGMTLEGLGEDARAEQEYLRGAEIADRSLENQERQAALALRSAAALEVKAGKRAVALDNAERAMRLLERGKAPADGDDVRRTRRMIEELKARG